MPALGQLEEMINRYPTTEFCRNDIYAAFEAMRKSYRTGGKLLIGGNGGSAADAMREAASNELSELRSGEMSEHIRKGLSKMATRRTAMND